MSDPTSLPEEAVDQWLANQHHTLVTDLSATLDLEAGLREALIPAQHASLIADLHNVLDVEAGLNSIVPAASTTPSDTQPVAIHLGEFVRDLAALSPERRLAIRHHLVHAPRLTDALVDALASTTLTRDSARDPDDALTRAEALTRDLDDILTRAAAVATTAAPAIAAVLAHAAAQAADTGDLADARDLARELAGLHHAFNDFSGVDLRNVDLAGVPLNGLRWSTTTRWPPDWTDRIMHGSVEVAPGTGIFELHGGTAHRPNSGLEGRSKTAVIEKSAYDSNLRKAGPLEQTWIERHRKWTDCKCDVIVKKGFATYICVKCGREI